MIIDYPMIEITIANSTAVDKLFYNVELKQLNILFVNKTEYLYEDVSDVEFFTLAYSDSIGSNITQLKDKRFTRLN